MCESVTAAALSQYEPQLLFNPSPPPVGAGESKQQSWESPELLV